MNNQKPKEYKWWQISEKISSTTDIEYLEKQIKNYFYITLVWFVPYTITSIAQDGSSAAIIEFVIYSIIILGVYRKKQWAAIAFFTLFVIERIMNFIMYPEVSYFTIYILICFGFFYVGMLSVLRLSELKKESIKKIPQSQD